MYIKTIHFNCYFIHLINCKTISLSIFDFFTQSIDLSFKFHRSMDNCEIDFFIKRNNCK